MRTPIVKVISTSLAGALALLVLTCAGQSQARGGAAATRIVAASAALDNSQEGFLISRGPVSGRCSVSLSSDGRERGRSASQHPGRAGELEFVWRFPAATSDQAWLAQLRCRGQRSLVRRITLHGGHARASGRRSIAIKVIVVSSTRPPRLVEPPARGAKGGGSYPPYGTVILPGSQWFGGHGVNVFSDGADGGTRFYQCVELFERFINTEGWYHGIAGAGIVGANQLFGAVPSSSFDKHPNGTGYIPVPGDAVIFSGLTFGHVAIVDYVSGGHVGLVEQNAAPSGRTSISISGSTLGKDGPYLSVIGVLHAKADHQAPGGEPVPTPTPTPTPAGGPIFTVMNTSETLPDGIYFRNSPHTSDTSRTAGIGVFAGEQVRLLCYAFGDSVGPYDDTLWYDVSNVTRATSNGTSNVGWLNAHYVNDGKPANQMDAGVPVCAGYPGALPSTPAPGPSPEPAPAPAPAPPPTYGETSGGVVHTWTNYSNAGGAEGPQIPSNATVQIACKVPGFRVTDGNTWWYRIASGPWNGAYYGSADAFYNNGATSGSLKGTPFVDPNVPNC